MAAKPFTNGRRDVGMEVAHLRLGSRRRWSARAEERSETMNRRIRQTDKDKDGDIIRVCNPDESWSPREKRDVINDIETGRHSYYVIWRDRRVHVIVVSGPRGKHIRTEPDLTVKDNLAELPPC